MSPGDETSSDEIILQEAFVLYNQSFKTIHVNTNGHLSFDSDVPAYRSHIAMPLGAYIVAAFFADIDTRGIGRVYYRNTSDQAVLERAAADVQIHFSGYETFMPKSLFIATWDRVGYYEENADKVNTFQIVLATDGTDTFAFFHYLDNGIQWKKSDGKFTPSYPDIPPQAGFEGGKDGSYFLLDGSGVTGDFIMGSNINVPGVWMYRIGAIQTGNVVSADLNTRDEQIFIPENAVEGCLQSTGVCSPNAECVDHSKGFCCVCVKPYYGNGYECLETNRPQTLNGRVVGSINGIALDDDHFMHTYVETKDGRTHSSISRIPTSIAPGLQTLNSIGGIVGWLFALRTGSTAKNGFEYTGGRFNRTARVTFQSDNKTDDVLRIYQTFQGFASPNNIRMETRIDGNMPEIPADATVVIDDYSEVYEKTAPGLIRSFAQRNYHVNSVPYRYVWENTINFEECEDDSIEEDGQDSMRVEVSRIYFNYDPTQMAYRFGMWSRILESGDDDPCASDLQNCDVNARCDRDGDSFVCTCRRGYDGDGVACEDIDECLRNPCDENARCLNMPGTFGCQCRSGYSGNGRTCQRDVQLCGNTICDDNARCVFVDDVSQPVCQCNSGYRGDGQRCLPVREDDCRQADICGDNAQCVYDDILREYTCECLDEFSGDGFECERIDRGCDACHPYAECVLDPMRDRYTCRCREGYTGDGRTCSVLETCGRCDRYARCVFNEESSTYQCVCVRGYEGDGQTCSRADCRNYDNLCAEEGGLCWVDPRTDKGICRCNYGYRGDGFRCDKLSCDVYNFCDRNAKCVAQGEEYVCQCDDGYVGDGRRCRPTETTCDVFNDCDRNARCVPDRARPGTYSCQCNPGFEGDGKRCEEKAEVSCNQVNNCDNYAECMYDPDRMSYRCVCRRGYEGDGLTCRRREIMDCRRNQRLCSPNAECVRSTDESYTCVCRPGYRGDGATCSPVVREGEYLVYGQGNKLMRVSTNARPGDMGQQLVFVPGQLPVGIDTDCDKGHLYWTDAAKGLIRRSRLDGSEMETVISGLKSPEGIAVDFTAGNMFYTDSELDVIQVAKLDGSAVRTLVDVDIVNPRAIVLDINKGTIYWTDWNRYKPQIEKINMDGTDREIFVSEDLRLPNGLTFDTYSQQLCWCDAGSKTIECIRGDGEGRRVIYDGTSYPFDLTILNNAIFWTDWQRRNIPNVNKNGEDPNEPLPLAIGGHGRIYGITAVRDQCPRVRNSCALNNGGCSYLCLPSPNGGRTCACPDGVDPRICQQ